MHFLRLLAVCWPGAQTAWDNHALACNFAKYSPIKKNFNHTLSNKPFLIWLLTTPSQLKYAATPPCNLSLMVCFADINVSPGSVATYARCVGMFNSHLAANFLRNLSVKKNFVNRLRFDRIMVMSLLPSFFGPPCILHTVSNLYTQNFWQNYYGNYHSCRYVTTPSGPITVAMTTQHITMTSRSSDGVVRQVALTVMADSRKASVSLVGTCSLQYWKSQHDVHSCANVTCNLYNRMNTLE